MKHITYIHEHSNWTEWQWSDKKLLPLVSRVRILQGRLLTPVRDKPYCNSLILFTMSLPVPAEACF